MARIAKITLVSAFIACATSLTWNPALAAPPASGCSEGFELKDVVEAFNEGYRLPIVWDAEGNNDGYMCRRALGDGVLRWLPNRPDTIYLLVDNTLRNT